jgi:hypothetical protein
LGMIQCGYIVTYRHPKKPKVEVIVHTTTKPSKRRTFKLAGGKARLEAVAFRRLDPNETNKEAVRMATKTRKRKAADDEELEELEGLEELDDLEDLDEEEEPEDEEDEDEDDEDEEPAPKRSRKAKAKPAAKKSRKRAPVEDDEDEDDEDEDEEDEAPRKRKTAKGKARSATSKSTKAKSSTKKSKGAKRGAPPGPRPVPKGMKTVQDVADALGVDGRAVRVFLRNHEDEFPKDEDSFRYLFTATEAKTLMKAFKNR